MHQVHSGHHVRPAGLRQGPHHLAPQPHGRARLTVPRLGQHFLVRQATLERIASAACPEVEPLVIEIGPGKGALTRFLLPRARRLIAIEFDRTLAAQLEPRLAPAPHLEVLAADVLEVDLGQWGPAVVAGNLPYYITSPVITRLLGLGGSLKRAVLMVQREVAERLAAAPGGRDYGFLTVHAQLLAMVELLFSVPRAAFRPPPKVDSAVLRLSPRPPDPALFLHDIPDFLAFAALAFRHKRKTLRNNLAASWPRSVVDQLPEASLRAEQLSLESLARVYHWLKLGLY